jgi:thiamine biosynthesis lipoprotein
VVAAAGFASAEFVKSAEPISPTRDPVVLRGRTMGTTYSVKLEGAGSAETLVELHRAIDALLEQNDRQMSTWRPDSEVSRFNRHGAGEWFAVSPATAAVVAKGLELHRKTDGASDVTIGPVLRAWHFGPDAGGSHTPLRAPSEMELNAARRRVGAEHLQARFDPPALRKNIEGVEVDLSSVAPGCAVDEIVELLAERGYRNAMVELGGEVRAMGRRGDGQPWRIGVESPTPTREIAVVVPLADFAVATSGDYNKYRTVEGVRYAHIFDPRTGRPLPYRGATVTVLAPTCVEADGLSTPLFVMGADAGFDWCVENNVAALYQEPGAQPGEVRRRWTPRFDERMRAAMEAP